MDAAPNSPDLSPVKRALLEIRDLRAKLREIEGSSNAPIAVIGMGARFPGAADVESYWRLLREGRSGISEVPADRWDVDSYYHPDPAAPGKMYVRRAGFLDQVDRFDADFFGIHPREAVTMDPQQRLVLEVAWEALEDAAQPPAALAESPTGVFLGIVGSDYFRLLLDGTERIDTYTASGGSPSVAAGRVSYLLGFQGPSLVVDTSCSSSLVAVHLACRSLRTRECRMALAGGVNLILTPEGTVALCKARMLSPDGQCKAFDESADGFARAEGCGVVVLKLLADALADGDPIHAVISGSAVNQDGRSGGLTVPNGPAQEAVIRAALADARVDPTEVTYLEAHGTGTALGDPIEVHALASALCTGRGADQPLFLGSVKTNIGHAEAAAGIAGLIKTILAVEHGQIPPHLHLKKLNPHIEPGAAPIRIPTEPASWPDSGRPRIAGVSSFGFSGTNAHVIVQQAPDAPASISNAALHTLRLSARTPEALVEMTRRYAAWFAANPDLSPADACFTAATGRKQFEHRGAWSGSSLQELREKLEAFTAGGPCDPWPDSAAANPGKRIPLPTYPFERRRFWIEEPVSAAWPEAIGAARAQSAQLPSNLDPTTYSAKWKALESLATASIVEALRDLGTPLRPGERHTPQSLLTTGGILPAYERLLHRWLRHLTARGLLQSLDDGSFIVQDTPAGPGREEALAVAVELFQDDRALLDYAAACGPKLANILRGEISPLETLFPGGDSTLAERLYEGSPLSRYFNSMMAAAAAAVSRAHGKGCRILEVGAGTGATTAAALPRLATARLEYCFTDVSSLFLTRARHKFAAYPFLSYRLLDLEKDPAEQGYPPGSFDMVLATNVLHATADLPQTLAHLRSLLAPRGVLALCEATQYLPWFDITTALIEGWQQFNDGIRQDHPLLTSNQWTSVLRDAGFIDVHAFPQEGVPTEILGQHVVLALAPTEAAAATATTVFKDDAATRFRQMIPDAAPAERRRWLQGFVRERLAAVLGLDSPESLSSARRLMDLGLDSLMALEFRESLERGLDLKGRLRSTLAFDFPTIDAVAEYLEAEILGGAPPRSLPVRSEAAATDGIAIVGAGCRLPGGVNDLDSFWNLLANGVDAIREIPRDRWNIDHWYDPDPDTAGKMATRWGGFLDGVDQFDPEFFGIAPREAESMDPQQRLLLEVSWEALENAAQNPGRLRESSTGVFVGLTSDDYARLLLRDDVSCLDSYYASGVARSVAAGRISYVLGLQGPNVSIDTACSSSLVAVHQACQSLRAGECRLALAGGANVILAPESTVALSRAHMMAPDGRCKTFDDSADGFVRAEGCVILVLKRLSDALQDRDHILAVIRGSSINQDGRSSGLTVPNGPAQEAVIYQALSEAAVQPSDVDYVEAHGTGTSLGDPIEVHALAAALGGGRTPDSPLRVGSVKTNLGHLEAAAGAAGLLKTALALAHREIPPSLHFHQWNRNISLKGVPVTVPVKLTAWEGRGRQRTAGVSSFGFSGTNAHVILQEAPLPAPSQPHPGVQVLKLSARSSSALRSLAERYCTFFEQHPDIALADVCYTAAVCRPAFAWKLEARGDTVDAMRRALDAAAQRGDFTHETALETPLTVLADPMQSGQKIPLPLTPFERSRYWRPGSRKRSAEHPLLGRRLSSPALTQSVFEISTRDWPAFLSEHRVAGKAVLPMAAYLEIFMAAANVSALEDVLVMEPLEFENNETIQVVAGTDRVELFRFCQDGWKLHAGARPARAGDRPQATPLRELQALADRDVDPRQKYGLLRELGVDLGPSFQLVRSLRAGTGHALGQIEMPPGAADYHAHPALIDACLQVLTAALGDADSLYLPLSIERFEWFERPSDELWCLAAVQRGPGDTLTGDLRVVDAGGRTMARLSALTLRRATPRRPENCLYELSWREKELSQIQDCTTAGSWLVLADSGGVGAALAADLQTGGAVCRILASNEPLAEALIDPSLTGVVHLCALDASSPEHSETASVGEAVEAVCGSILEVVQNLAARVENPLQLVLVTRGAYALNAGEIAPAQGPVWGLARTIRLEHPELRCVAVDLDPQDEESARALSRELLQSDGETQVAWRGKVRTVARLAPLPGDSVHLELAGRGSLDHLILGRAARQHPGRGEVEIRVAAAGLNFRDVMNALDLYPGDPGPLGAECSGVVVDVGEGVEDFATGDAVMAIAPGSLGSHVTAATALVARKPAHLTMEQAAALPVAFVTARYALHLVGAVRTGESVLIHAAAGGVGLAAIAEAQRAGAEVFVTAGSEEKRAWLRSLGIRHVMSSRNLDFAREVMEQTGGRGIDLVLNSLGGDFIAANLRVLAHGGRYLEIGKNGIWDEARVAKERPDVRYSIIDWGEEYEREPQRIAGLFRELMRDVQAGSVAPLPCRAFKLGDAQAAFRWMAQARHIGKVVLTPAAVREGGAYLITGGLGGLGLRVAERLVERGARDLFLVGRSAPGAEAQEAIRRMTARGGRVTTHQADVSQKSELGRVFEQIASLGTPLKGVVHAAAYFENAVLLQQNAQRLARVLAPKVHGAWALHQLTASMDLDFFVMFSSIASVFGGAGQAGDAAANSFLDSLAHYRRSQGLPAVSINWGAWSEAGAAAEERTSSYISSRGAGFLSAEQGLDLFELSLLGDKAQFTAALLNWPDMKRTLQPHAAFLSEVTGTPGEPAREIGATPPLVAVLARTDAGRRQAVLLEEVRRRACAVLRLSPEHPVDPLRPLSDLGLDSLMAVELRNALVSAIGKPLPSTLIFSYPSTAAIAQYLATRLDQPGQPEEPGAPAPEVEDFLSTLERLSEGEVERLLSEAAEQTS